MTSLIDDYLRDVEQTLRADTSRKRQIVDELRTHLTEKVDDQMQMDPARPRAEVEQEVLREFGNPRDLALAYEPEGAPVLLNSAGDIVLRLGKAMGRGAAAAGRGAGKALKWVAIALAGLLVVSLGVGAWAYYEVKPYIPAIIESSEPAYSYLERCGETPCNGAAPADSFFVRPDARTVRFDLDVYAIHPGSDWEEHVGNGSVHVVVTDPAGTVRFDRAYNLSDEAQSHQETSWAAVAGNWSVSYEFVDFIGGLDVRTYAVALPFGDDA